MIISERIYQLMEARNITQLELSQMTGIAQSTMSDWKHKKTNPAADKIMIICDALEVTPEELLQDTMTERQIEAKVNKDLEDGVITLNQAKKILKKAKNAKKLNIC